MSQIYSIDRIFQKTIIAYSDFVITNMIKGRNYEQ